MTDEERKARDKARWNAYDAAHRPQRRAKDKARYAANIEAMRARNRAYHAANKQTILARSRARYAAKKAADLARKTAYRKAHPELVRQQARALYFAKTPKERSEINRRYNALYAEYRKRWRAENAQRIAELASLWSRANAHLKRAAKAKRRAATLKATPQWADFDAIKKIYTEAVRLTRETGIVHEVDHIVPLISDVVCGLHCEANLRVITRTENRRKSNLLKAS